jgi:hypothetical protein
MGTNSVVAAFASGLRRLARVTPPVLVIVILLGCAAGIAYALNGYTVYSWGTKTDTVGIDIGDESSHTCVLCGVAGNLNAGAEQGFGCGLQGEESIARVSDKVPSTGHYWLVAHGGACGNQVNQKVWDNNPVNGQATCFLIGTNVTNATWKTMNSNAPVKITGLNTGTSDVRQCFLSGLWGVAGAWNSSSNFARVRRVTATDNTHPTTGWYVEANLPKPEDGSHPRVEARCVDFPKTTVITTGTAPVITVTETYSLTSGGGIKACALTEIKGAFNVNSYTNGVTMKFPPQATGNWSLTVTAGKSAKWACAR